VFGIGTSPVPPGRGRPGRPRMGGVSGAGCAASGGTRHFPAASLRELPATSGYMSLHSGLLTCLWWLPWKPVPASWVWCHIC
jgi:hypothetical protein